MDHEDSLMDEGERMNIRYTEMSENNDKKNNQTPKQQNIANTD